MPRLIPRRPRRGRAVDALARSDLATPGGLRRGAIAQGIDLAQDMSRAVELKQLTLHYQPIVRLRTGECTRVEALLRWEHPQLGPVPPAELLLLAEQLGLLVEDVVGPARPLRRTAGLWPPSCRRWRCTP